jgi:hypothetical protein
MPIRKAGSASVTAPTRASAASKRRVSAYGSKKAASKRKVAASQRKPAPGAFDYSLDFAAVDFRRRPDLYRIGKGEQGVLLVEPYKSELLPHWRFRTPRIARASAGEIFQRFLRYKAQGDFVGMDMARKFLQMGYTRARRYANHRSGRKYDPDTGSVMPLVEDPAKAQAAAIFRSKWRKAAADPDYLRLKALHRARFERPG